MVVGLRPTGSTKWRHGMGTGIFAQRPQSWRVRAQIGASETNPQVPLVASHYCCSPSHGGQEEGVGDGVSERGMQGMCMGSMVGSMVLWVDNRV